MTPKLAYKRQKKSLDWNLHERNGNNKNLIEENIIGLQIA